jgi:predicted ATP-binding protein involved in virulence
MVAVRRARIDENRPMDAHDQLDPNGPTSPGITNPSPAVRFETLRLSNIGGFRSLDLTFHPSLTVLCGRNGAGKTTVLRSLGALLSGLLQQRNNTGLSIRRERRGSASETLFIEALPAAVKARVSFDALSSELVFDLVSPADLQTTPLFHRSRPSIDQMTRWQGLTSKPVVVHYGVSRAGDPASNEEQIISQALTHKPSPADAYFGWWNPAVSLAHFAGWLAVQYLVEQETGQRTNLLDLSDQAVVNVLPGASSARYSFREKELLISFEDGTEKLGNTLSDGERSLLSIAGDIVSRLGRLHGDQPLELLRHAPGIVLIDELDLHLHPGWQQKIAPRLVQTFPGMQFIVTSHSPTLISTVDAECVRILDRDADGTGHVTVPTFTNGAEAQVMLERLFGVESRWPESALAKELAAYDDMLANGQWDTDEGRSVFDHIVALSHNEDPGIGRLVAAQRLAAYRSRT